MVQLRQVVFRYPTERFELRIAELNIAQRETVAVVGPSGSGKTTTLRLMAGILVPQDGSVQVLEKNVGKLAEKQRRAFRIRNIGLVFQDFELLDYLTAWENILLPFRISAALQKNDATLEKGRQLAASTGIERLLEAYPRQLSQGERQRVAICRALITGPRLILADEPTGSLDPKNQQRIVDLLLEQAREHEATLVMVTHDHGLLHNFERSLELPKLTGRES